MSNKGFSVVELLVAMAISGIVMAAIYSTFYSQNKSYVTNEQAIAMHQNLRAALYYTGKEIRMAGCDPTRMAGAGITTANKNSILFTMDIHDGIDNDGDGTVDEGSEAGNVNGNTNDNNESIQYYLNVGNLVKNSDTNIISENIDALDFIYLDGNGNTLDDDGNGNVTTNIPQIRSLRITIVARTGKKDATHIDNNEYRNEQGDIILGSQNDNYHRKIVTTQIRCRNL